MFQPQRMIGLSLILACSLALASCETIKRPLIQSKDGLVLQESQFECGPRPPNLPAPDIIQNWSSSQLLDLTEEYWFWGERCDKTNNFNRNYFYCYKDDKAACDELKKLSAIIKEQTKTAEPK